MTEEDNEDSDPGGTTVFRVTCLDDVFGLTGVFQTPSGLDTLGIIERKDAFLETGNSTHPSILEIGGVVL